MRNVGAAAVAVMLLASCASQPRPPAVTCPPAVQAAENWPAVAESTGAYQLRMPSSFTPVPPGEVFFVHGGDVWKDGDRRISISFGHWAEMSFDEEPGERCRTRIGDADVFLIVSPTSVLAWYSRESGSHEPVVSVSSKSGDLGMLAAVALSLERR
jgi:hypothetical protein